MPEPLTHVRQISHIAYGFMASQALFAALNIGLFGHISSGKQTLESLCALTGIAEHRLKTLMAVLVSLGLVVGEEDGFTNAPATERYLVPGAPAYFGDYYRFQIDRQIYHYMPHVHAGLAGDPGGLAHESMGGLLADPRNARDFSKAQHAGSLGPAKLMVEQIDLSGAKTLLDVAGGTGAYSITFCAKYPALKATILDFPSVIEVAREYVNHAGMAGRIGLIGGDATKTAWPEQQTVVLMSYLLSAVGGGQIPALLDSAWKALAPGGRLIIHDFMLHEDREGPLSAALFFLSYLALRTDPISFTAGELTPLLSARGFTHISSGEMIPEITGFILAQKV